LAQQAYNKDMKTDNLSLNEAQIHRYSRNIILKEVGGIGQRKLLNAKVLVVGAGGLGSPILFYLASAGVGTIGIIDDDVVELSNLQRQIMHSSQDLNKKKISSAYEKINNLNPDVKINTLDFRLDKNNVEEIIQEYDFIADGSDNFSTRFILNDACFEQNKILISGAVQSLEGYLTTFNFTDKSSPCYRCIFPEPSENSIENNCSTAGVIGSLAGVVGSLQATEIIKEILQIGDRLKGWLVLIDGLNSDFRKIKIKKDPKCNLCSGK